ncbi:hypothetical protein GGI20_003244 [Coemansia sp. BCRC 34301]|nr:hypothetical protein GGI20_003244 [Coemansia sp. BCRC 34301]
MHNNTDAITILRVKRKRDQEPLDALVLHKKQQNQRKKFSRLSNSFDDECATPLLFALGETISESDFGDSGKLQALQDRLTQLSTTYTGDNTMEVEEERVVANRQPPQQFRVVSKQQVRLGDNYRQGIPQVLSAADMRGRHAAQQRAIAMFDAVTDDRQDLRHQNLGPRDPYAEIALGHAPSPSPLPPPAATGVDDLVPMVRDYLSLAPADCAPEYVYDFYYARSAQSSDALLSMGSVTWMVDEDLDDESSDEDDEDEDSNSEGYYANDYPDDDDEEYDDEEQEEEEDFDLY